jgi:hypothetical protein
VRELVLLFKAVDEQQRADASPEAPRAVVSPNGLREALSHTAEFKLGAATAVLTLLMWLLHDHHRHRVYLPEYRVVPASPWSTYRKG